MLQIMYGSMLQHLKQWSVHVLEKIQKMKHFFCSPCQFEWTKICFLRWVGWELHIGWLKKDKNRNVFFTHQV